MFIDGCYWHGCPKHYRPARINAEFWSTKIADNRERDARSTEMLRDAGWTVLRFWEHEPPEDVASAIAGAVAVAR
ncbi:Very short patch repair protein [Rhodococcus sp. B50]|nr:Very short patch repair protein [Rhodococcus sp. B50]